MGGTPRAASQRTGAGSGPGRVERSSLTERAEADEEAVLGKVCVGAAPSLSRVLLASFRPRVMEVMAHGGRGRPRSPTCAILSSAAPGDGAQHRGVFPQRWLYSVTKQGNFIIK